MRLSEATFTDLLPCLVAHHLVDERLPCLLPIQISVDTLGTAPWLNLALSTPKYNACGSCGHICPIRGCSHRRDICKLGKFHRNGLDKYHTRRLLEDPISMLQQHSTA